MVLSTLIFGQVGDAYGGLSGDGIRWPQYRLYHFLVVFEYPGAIVSVEFMKDQDISRDMITAKAVLVGPGTEGQRYRGIKE